MYMRVWNREPTSLEVIINKDAFCGGKEVIEAASWGFGVSQVSVVTSPGRVDGSASRSPSLRTSQWTICFFVVRYRLDRDAQLLDSLHGVVFAGRSRRWQESVS